jgi:hypothetical protein
MVYSPQEPAILGRGKIYMIQSILDPDTSFSTAKKLYDKTQGHKAWIPLQHTSSKRVPEFVEMVLEAEIKGKSSTVVDDCINVDAKMGTDWNKVWMFEPQEDQVSKGPK